MNTTGNMLSMPRPRHFVHRLDGTMTALIALDELPEFVRISNVPITLTVAQTQGMISLGVEPKSDGKYAVERIDYPTLNTPCTGQSSNEPQHVQHRASPTIATPAVVQQNPRADAEGVAANTLNGTEDHDHTVPAGGNANEHPVEGWRRSVDAADMSDDPRTPASPPISTVPSVIATGPSVPAYNPMTPGIFHQKIYCTHWLRTGECDFMQQGCIFKHEMPSLEVLATLGFRYFPRWYREAYHIEDRPPQPAGRGGQFNAPPPPIAAPPTAFAQQQTRTMAAHLRSMSQTPLYGHRGPRSTFNGSIAQGRRARPSDTRWPANPPPPAVTGPARRFHQPVNPWIDRPDQRSTFRGPSDARLHFQPPHSGVQSTAPPPAYEAQTHGRVQPNNVQDTRRHDTSEVAPPPSDNTFATQQPTEIAPPLHVEASTAEASDSANRATVHMPTPRVLKRPSTSPTVAAEAQRSTRERGRTHGNQQLSDYPPLRPSPTTANTISQHNVDSQTHAGPRDLYDGIPSVPSPRHPRRFVAPDLRPNTPSDKTATPGEGDRHVNDRKQSGTVAKANPSSEGQRASRVSYETQTTARAANITSTPSRPRGNAISVVGNRQLREHASNTTNRWSRRHASPPRRQPQAYGSHGNAGEDDQSDLLDMSSNR